MIQFGVLFLVLAGFTLVSIGAVQSQSELVTAVSAAKDNNPGKALVQVQDGLFDDKVFHFLKQDKICALTAEQIAEVDAAYDIETKLFDVEGGQQEVIYVKGNPLNKNILEKLIGESLDDDCNVVHGNKIIAVLSPVFVS